MWANQILAFFVQDNNISYVMNKGWTETKHWYFVAYNVYITVK